MHKQTTTPMECDRLQNQGSRLQNAWIDDGESPAGRDRSWGVEWAGGSYEKSGNRMMRDEGLLGSDSEMNPQRYWLTLVRTAGGGEEVVVVQAPLAR
jgi:hypothetical protein